MKTRLTFILSLIALGGLLAFSSCDSGPSPEDMIARSWKLKTLNVKNQPPPPPHIMANSVFIFSKNGRYEILLGDVDRGTWRLSEDKKVLITITDGQFQEKHIDITELKPDHLILTNNMSASPVTMELVPSE